MKEYELKENPLLKLVAAALRSRGDLPPEADDEALEVWLERLEATGSAAPSEPRLGVGDWLRLPEGWAHRFLVEGDLEKSFQELEGVSLFHAQTMQGRIRSLQLRFEEATNHFERAYELLSKEPENTENLVRGVLLEIYRLENALLERPVDNQTVDLCFQSPFGGRLIECTGSKGRKVEQPARLVLAQRKLCEALVYLHLGDYVQASEIFTALIHNYPLFPPSQLAGYYLGLAICQESLGLEAEAATNLQNAALAARMIPAALPCAIGVSALVGIHRFLGDDSAAREWRDYLQYQIRCPRATKEILLKRSELLLERCSMHGRLVLF